MTTAPPLFCVTLLDDRIIFHGPDDPREFPLAYQIHSRLIQTGELARLLCEHLREEAGAALPAAGTPLRLALPSAWGLVCLKLPYTGLEGLAQPMHQLAWEVATGAPEQAEQYFYDFHESVPDDGPGEAGATRVLAIRQSLVQFCLTFCEELGWRLVEILPAGEAGADFVLDVERARAHQNALALERFATIRRWPALLLKGALALGLAAAGIWLVLGPLSQLHQRSFTKPIDDEKAGLSVPEATRISAPEPAPADWADLLTRLAAVEERLPDFMALDAEGLLTRSDPAAAPDGLEELLGRPALGRRQGGARWLAFEKALSGDGQPEDGSRQAEHFTLARLDELASRLGPCPGRVILQRRRTEGDSVTTRWRFTREGRPGEARGWSVTIFHSLAAPTTAAADSGKSR